MKKFILIYLISHSLLIANEYAIVANKSIHEASLGQIKALFLKKSSYIKNKKVVPVNLSSRNPIRIHFEKHILHMSFNRLKSYWTKQHYLGHRPPISMKSQKSIKTFIKKVDGSIGYMELKNVDDELSILYKWSE